MDHAVPNSFMANALRWKPQLDAGDTVRLPFAGVPIALVDQADVGAVAAAALTDDRDAERSYRLSRPEALLPESQVAILAAALGRRLVLEPQSDAEARRQMQTQMPAEYVDAFFAFFAEGTVDETTVWPTAAEVLERPPGTFAAWARQNAPPVLSTQNPSCGIVRRCGHGRSISEGGAPDQQGVVIAVLHRQHHVRRGRTNPGRVP